MRILRSSIFAIIPTFLRSSLPYRNTMLNHASHNNASEIYAAQQALGMDGELFRAIFESSADALFISEDDNSSRVIECNERALALFETDDKHLLIGGVGGSRRLRPLTEAELRQRTEELHKQGSVYSEVQYRSCKGRIFWVAHLMKLVVIGDKRFRLTRITDINERKNAERELQRHKEMLEEAQSVANIGSWEFDLETQQITWSAETFRIFGMNPETDAPPTFEEYMQMVSPQNHEHAAQAIREASLNGTPYIMEGRIVGRNGKVRYQEGRGKGIKNAEGKVVRLVGTVRDVSERHQRLQELQQSEMRLRSIIDNTNAILATIAFDGTITFASNTFYRMLGFTPEMVIGNNFGQFLHPDYLPLLMQLMEQTQRGETEGSNVEVQVRHANGIWLWFNIITSLVRDEQGKPSHLVSIARDITEQKQMQEQLRKNEESLAEAQKMAHLGNWYADLQTGLIEWSSELYRIFALPETTKPMSGKDFLDVVHQDDRERVRQAFIRAIKHQELGQEELRIIRKGVVRWLDARMKPVIGADGTTVALFGTVWDITERKITDQQIRALNLTLEERVQERTKQLEDTNKQLRSSQSNLKTLIESTNDAIWSIDRAYRLTAMNAAFYSLLTIYNQYREPQLGDSTLEIVPGASVLAWRHLYDRALSGERFSTLMNYVLTGLLFDVEISFNPIIDEQSEIVGVVVYSRDITERLQRERDLREREELLQLIFDTVPVGISLTDRNGVYQRVNTEFVRMLGYDSPQDFKDTSFSELLPPQARATLAKQYRDFFDSGQRQKGAPSEAVMLRRDGTLLPVFFASSLFNTANGEKLSITTITDITPRKQAEDEIKKALEQERELSNLKSRFVVMVSHEFRTPLTTIRASAQLLERLRERMSAEKQSEYLHDIQQAVDTMAHLMEDILYLGKADARGLDFSPAPVHVIALCESIINGFEIMPENEHRIVAHITGILPEPMLLDEKLLRQILTNLLSNALKYSPLEQSVYFSMEFLAENHHSATTKQQGMMRFSVKDSGIGISEEDQKHLFEPFYRADNVGSISGTGLGLTIVKQAVETHGGTITCKTALNRGTEFVVVIPCQVA